MPCRAEFHRLVKMNIYLPTENKAWENSPCLLGAANGHVLPGNTRWCWVAAAERWSYPVPEREITLRNYKQNAH